MDSLTFSEEVEENSDSGTEDSEGHDSDMDRVCNIQFLLFHSGRKYSDQT